MNINLSPSILIMCNIIKINVYLRNNNNAFDATMLSLLSDINECASDPCQHGTCKDLINEYACECNPGYTGLNCQTSKCPALPICLFIQKNLHQPTFCFVICEFALNINSSRSDRGDIAGKAIFAW